MLCFKSTYVEQFTHKIEQNHIYWKNCADADFGDRITVKGDDG